jgi:hypothetical protein
MLLTVKFELFLVKFHENDEFTVILALSSFKYRLIESFFTIFLLAIARVIIFGKSRHGRLNMNYFEKNL